MKAVYVVALHLLIALLRITPSGAACTGTGEDACPTFELTSLVGNYVNYSYTANWTVAKRMNGPTADDGAQCRDTTRQADGYWSSTCTWRLNCGAHNGSLVFRRFNLNVREGGTVQVTNFSIWNLNVATSPLISVGNLYVPRDAYASREYDYRPDTLITGNSAHTATISLTLTSARPPSLVDSEVDIFLNFTCSRIFRYVYVELTPDLPSDDNFWSIVAAYIIPGIITVIIIIIALIRYCNPDLTMSLKKWAGYKELEDESRTRHAKIKDKAGGGTWYDNAAEVVSDLSRANIDKTEARVDASEDDEELEAFTPKNTIVKKSEAASNKNPRRVAGAPKRVIKEPVRPQKERSGDSIDLDSDDSDKMPAAKATATTAKRDSADELGFSDSDDSKSKGSDSDDVL